MVRVFLFLYFANVLSIKNRITVALFLVVGLILTTKYGFSQNGKFHINTLFPSNVADTLNVKRYAFSQWVYEEKGAYLLNTLDGIHNFYPGYPNAIVRNDLGNLGSANHLTFFEYERPFGFQFRTARSIYWKHVADRSFLLSEKMFSNVQYANGVKRENDLVANFTRNFGKLLNIGFRFNRNVSEGFYAQQRNVFTDMSVYSTFRTYDNRYRAVLMFNYSNLLAEENGGIANDTIFRENLTTDRAFIPVNLAQASNHWKGFDLGLEHRLLLSKTDTNVVAKRGVYKPAISHSFSVGRHSMVYSDLEPKGGFYQRIYNDSIATRDSTLILNVKNVLRFELTRPDTLVAALQRWAIGVEYDYNRIAYDTVFQDVIHNVSVLTSAHGKLFKKVDWRATGNLMVYGYNSWDFKVDGKFSYRVGSSRLGAFVTYSLFRPDYLTDNYVSNHFVWDNEWKQTQHWKTGLLYTQQRLRLRASFTYHLLDNLVGFGVDRKPYQSTALNQLLVLRVEEHFRLRWFHLMVDGAVQYLLSGDDIRVPLVLGRGMFFYQNDLFKKKLRLQVGVEASYSMAYLANAYNPALSAFHLQNNTQVGNYPFLDVFVNIRVKKLRAFFKVEHFNAGWMGYRYYHVPGYPVNDLAWKFGINWAFLD